MPDDLSWHTFRYGAATNHCRHYNLLAVLCRCLLSCAVPRATGDPEEPCMVCSPGTYASGRGVSPCLPCPAGHTSIEGAAECFPEDEGPPGTGPTNKTVALRKATLVRNTSMQHSCNGTSSSRFFSVGCSCSTRCKVHYDFVAVHRRP